MLLFVVFGLARNLHIILLLYFLIKKTFLIYLFLLLLKDNTENKIPSAIDVMMFLIFFQPVTYFYLWQNITAKNIVISPNSLVWNFVERVSFRMVSEESPETIRKLYFSIKFPHQKIRWNYVICLSVIRNCLLNHVIFMASIK